ncbi:glycosyltransferase 87 family protein [Micromonosporaceae bacterium Da 78-11]
MDRARTKGSAVAGLGCLAALWAIGFYLHRYGLSGLAVDIGAVRSWLAGDGLYAYRSPGSRLGTAEPPVAAILISFGAGLPLTLTGGLIALAGVTALLLALIALVGPVARRYGRSRRPAVLVAAGLALMIEPVRATLGLGRLDLLLFGLVAADIVALRRGAWARSRAAWWPGRPASQPQRGRLPADLLRRGWATGAWAGIGTGIATALAVSPVLFIAYFVLTRQWRAAFTALGTTVSLLIGALLIAPSATATWFDSVLTQFDRAGPVDAPGNQSLAGVLARLYDSTTAPVLIWLAFAGLLVAVGMIRARSAHADGDEIAAFTVVGLTSAVVGPVSDVHELIWVLPAMLILVDAAARRRVVGRGPRPARFAGARWAAAAALVFVLCAVDPVWTLGWNAYAIMLVVLLNTLPWRPGVAPAFPINRWPRPVQPVRRVPAIPGPRGS